MPIAQPDRPTRPAAEPAGTEIEVTPEMIEAGVRAYYDNAMWGWESPGGEELRNLLGQVYRDMARLAPNIRAAE